MAKIIVKDTEIAFCKKEQEDYISLTDIAKFRDMQNPLPVINSWLQTYNAVEYLGLWEKLSNTNFNHYISEGFKIESTKLFFELSPQKWICETNAIGIMMKTERYGDVVYAHSDIAFKFAAWISVEFELYLVAEFKRLKTEEHKSFGRSASKRAEKKDISLHDQVKKQILLACKMLGVQAQNEYRGTDWRADVFALGSNGTKYAFEVQTSQQSLNRTLERQAKYQRDGIVGCWLFEKEPSRMNVEREDLPLFKIKEVDGQIYVSLKERKELPLDVFVNDYLQDKIQFRPTLSILPKVDIVFMEMDCWKCGTKNHIYYIGDFVSPCNTKIHHQEAMWNSDKLVFRPEIIRKVREYASSEKGNTLNIGQIKERYSKTTEHSYMSFGCSKCDSIFGDWFVHEATIEAWYGGGVVDRISFDVSRDVDPKFDLRLNVPHWCHPGEHEFCK